MAILILTFAGGCLWSPAIEEAEGETLYPPVIDLMMLTPKVGEGILTIDDPGCVFTFKVGVVRELNTRDVLYVRWYEDFVDDWLKVAPVRDLYLAPDGNVDRTGSPQLDWDLVITGQTTTWKQTFHTVTVFVADRPYANPTAEDDNPSEIMFKDADAQYDTWQWTFKVSPELICE
ncbi:MAG TPA: hypothetical protein PK668_26400 [Myxococcota bacterium]|nr:hypothetical protein [Myxococcota bacterium]HRY97059.1 hypothetical protein [Myxococcota bacterium]HSA20978.1 hypothetical protein [Myxococcota bacterium]